MLGGVMWRSLHPTLVRSKPGHYRVVVKCFASGQCGPGAEIGADAYSPPNGYVIGDNVWLCQIVAAFGACAYSWFFGHSTHEHFKVL